VALCALMALLLVLETSAQSTVVKSGFVVFLGEPWQACVSFSLFCMLYDTVQNNPRTRNLNALLGHMLVRLGSVAESTEATLADTVNAVFLSRTFLKHTIDTSGASAVVAHLDAGKKAVRKTGARSGMLSRSPDTWSVL
jgi:hypothetical protein